MSTSRLLDRQTVAEGTMSFRMERPAGFSYRPGQTVDVTLPTLRDDVPGGNIHTFSLADDPDAQGLLVATRMRGSAFKNEFARMPIGGALDLMGPSGDFTLPNRDTRAIVLLAGGIGITPFSAMVRYAAHHKLNHRIILFYGNRRPEDAPFLDDLLALQKENPRFTFVPVMSEMEKSSRPWDGARGFIDAKLMAPYLKDVHEPIYFIAGPPGMVTALRKTLHDAAVDDDDIRTEEFSGY
ncbi:MAG: FAD-dependent oxidoreductase [Acidobacteria bacterium]|nr:MAG: FAD-dependent oxidoreductase [Acidobacteriota bacterium]